MLKLKKKVYLLFKTVEVLQVMQIEDMIICSPHKSCFPNEVKESHALISSVGSSLQFSSNQCGLESAISYLETKWDAGARNYIGVIEAFALNKSKLMAIGIFLFLLKCCLNKN